MQQRPTGVTILAVLALVAGIISFAAGLVLMFGGTMGSVFGVDEGSSATVLGAIEFAVGLVSLLLGYGFWTSRPWAWSAGFVVFGALVAVDLASIVLIHANPISVALPIAMSVLTMWYLLQPQVRASLGR